MLANEKKVLNLSIKDLKWLVDNLFTENFMS